MTATTAGRTFTVFVGGLSSNTDENDIRSWMKSCGTIVDIRFALDQNGLRKRGIAFVDFATYENASLALLLNGTELNGRYIAVKMTSTTDDKDTEHKLVLNKNKPRESEIGLDNISEVAKRINRGDFKKIIVMTGAGMSVSAGIPDFRSPKTGLYANLSEYNLPYPEAIFELDFFHKTPQAFVKLAKELYPGSFKPTPAHMLLKHLCDKKWIKRIYTQNIDELDRQAGVPEDLLVEAHGNFQSARCIDCNETMPADTVKSIITKEQVPKCGRCGGWVKPDIVFFGEDLPSRYYELSKTDFDDADLLLIMGTSLSVAPFNRLVKRVKATCPRIVVNLTRIENPELDLDSDRDYFIQSTTDAFALKITSEINHVYANIDYKVGENQQSCVPANKVGENQRCCIPANKVGENQQSCVPANKVGENQQSCVPANKVGENQHCCIPKEEIKAVVDKRMNAIIHQAINQRYDGWMIKLNSMQINTACIFDERMTQNQVRQAYWNIAVLVIGLFQLYSIIFR